MSPGLCVSIKTHTPVSAYGQLCAVYGCVCRQVNTHVSLWASMGLSMFLHKHLKCLRMDMYLISLQKHLYVVICLYVYTSVFLQLWGYELVNTSSGCLGWHIYVSACFSGPVWVWSVYFWLHAALCLHTELCAFVWICVDAYVYLCRHEMIPVGTLGYALIFV